jgi:branched-chain amino acid transport system ATP-binding protein
MFISVVVKHSSKTFHMNKYNTQSEPVESVNTPQALLECRKLNAWYGAAQILFDVSLSVCPGEVVALMGRNGAGKSTTLRALMGLMSKRSGEISFLGDEIGKLEPFQISQKGLGFVPEDRRIFSDLSVLENLSVGRQVARFFPNGDPVPYWTVDAIFSLFPNLGNMPKRLGSQMSGGEQQMLSVARTLMGNPIVLLLDEPSEGIAPIIVEQMGETILKLKAQGVSILLSEQNLHFAGWVCDRAYILEKGQIKHASSMKELNDNQQILKEYLSV